MILRAIDESGVISGATPVPVWTVIERTQQQPLTECWLIPQPAHAALSGDIAAKLDPKVFPGLDHRTIRAIALHDSGWSPMDAAAIQDSRAAATNAKQLKMPRSFLQCSTLETVSAWIESIEIAEKVSLLGSYIVSQHFLLISKAVSAPEKDVAVMSKFGREECARQQRLRKKIDLADEKLSKLVEALQFSDLLSLYICCGAYEPVEFPQKVEGRQIKLLPEASGQACHLEPSPFLGEEMFGVNAIRHPKLKDIEGNIAMFVLKVA